MRRQSYLFEVMIVLGLVFSLGVNAQNPFDWQRDANGSPFVSSPGAMSQPRAVEAGRPAVYTPTIYAVGTDEVPSDAYNPDSESQTRNNKPSVRNGFITGPEEGRSDEYPVGEPLVLLLFAVAFLAFRLVRTSSLRIRKSDQ